MDTGNVINWAELHKNVATSLEGDFPVMIVEAAAARTSSGEKEMIKYKAKIESGPHANRPVWGQFVISPESPVAMRIMFAHWAVLGLDASFFGANPNATTAQLAQALVGRRAVVEIGVRQWNGQDREEIKTWKPPFGGAGGSGGPLGGPLATGVGATSPLPTSGNPTARHGSPGPTGSAAFEPTVAAAGTPSESPKESLPTASVTPALAETTPADFAGTSNSAASAPELPF